MILRKLSGFSGDDDDRPSRGGDPSRDVPNRDDGAIRDCRASHYDASGDAASRSCDKDSIHRHNNNNAANRTRIRNRASRSQIASRDDGPTGDDPNVDDPSRDGANRSS